MIYKRDKKWWTKTLLDYLREHRRLSMKQWTVLSRVSGIPVHDLMHEYKSNLKRK